MKLFEEIFHKSLQSVTPIDEANIELSIIAIRFIEKDTDLTLKYTCINVRKTGKYLKQKLLSEINKSHNL
jgi:hypothetical protein